MSVRPETSAEGGFHPFQREKSLDGVDPVLSECALFFVGRQLPHGRKNRMAAKKAAKKPAKKTARKPNAAFMKAMQPSAALAKIVGEKPLPRTEVVKKLWQYVKKNNLQDKKEKRNINADDQLREVFGGKKTVSMFEMTKLVNDNLS